MTVIVGAGAAGLSLACMLDDAEVLEAADHPGGLCSTHHVDGFTFDQGPHILGGIPESVAWIVESTGIEYVAGVNRSRGFYEGRWCEHPFADEAVGLCYMAKMWKRDPADLHPGRLGAQPGRRPGGVREFLYPARGGYQAITDAWATQCKVSCGVWVDSVEARNMVWTAPVPGAPYNGLCVTTLGYEGSAPDLTAVYLPGDETPYHRISFPSAFSPHNAPAGHFSVQGEVSLNGHGTLAGEWPIDSLREVVGRLGLSHRSPVFADVCWVPNAYPVPVKGDLWWPPDLIGHGRTGGHRYLNVDGVIAMSMALAKTLQ